MSDFNKIIHSFVINVYMNLAKSHTLLGPADFIGRHYQSEESLLFIHRQSPIPVFQSEHINLTDSQPSDILLFFEYESNKEKF